MNALARNKDNPLDNIDPKRFLIIARQLEWKRAETDQNRSQLEQVMAVEGAVESQNKLMMGQARVSTADVEGIARRRKEIADKKLELNEQYNETSKAMKPIIALHNECKNFLDTNGVSLPTEFGLGGAQFVTFTKGSPLARSKLIPTIAGALGKNRDDPIALYKKTVDRLEANKREKAKVEHTPMDPAEVAAKWESVVDKQGEIGRRLTPFDNDPDPRVAGSREIIFETFATGDGGRVSFEPVAQFLCAVFPNEIKKFIRAVNPPNPDAIKTEVRKATLKRLEDDAIAIQFDLERAARAIEAMGMQVIRPGDLDPRIFLAGKI